MELKVKAITFPEVIEFNFEELKQEITERTSDYVNLVYDDSQMKEAKKDRATLKKFVEALSDERIKIKKDCLKPYEEFERKINELSGIVDGAIKNIDTQIKSYEEQQKEEKKKQIEAFFETRTFPDGITLEQISDKKWLNASVSLKSIQEVICLKETQIQNDLVTLSNLPEFAFEATEVYKTTLDMNKAICEGQRLLELQKRKEEQKAKQEQVKVEQQKDFVMEEVAEPKESITEPVNRTWVGFQALLSTEEALALRQFFEEHHIEFRAI